MNVKKSITSVLAVLLSVGAFAYPAIPNDDQTAQLLQQYEQQIQELQAQLEQKLSSPCKALGSFLLQDVQAKIEGLSEEQIETIIEERAEQLTPEQLQALADENLTEEELEALSQGLVLAALIEQEKQVPFVKEKLAEVENILTEVLAPSLKDFNLAQFNELYNQTFQVAGLPEHQFTLQEATDMLKATYLSAALISFLQEEKLTNEESALLTVLFFTQKQASPAN